MVETDNTNLLTKIIFSNIVLLPNFKILIVEKKMDFSEMTGH